MNILLILAAIYVAYKWGGQAVVQRIEDTNEQISAFKSDGKTLGTAVNAMPTGDVAATSKKTP